MIKNAAKGLVGCMGAGAAGFCTTRYFRCTSGCILVPGCKCFFAALASADPTRNMHAYNVNYVLCRSSSQDGEADATRFQYVGYDPNSDKAIVQFMGSRKVSQLDAEEFLRMGSSGLCEHKSGLGDYGLYLEDAGYSI